MLQYRFLKGGGTTIGTLIFGTNVDTYWMMAASVAGSSLGKLSKAG